MPQEEAQAPAETTAPIVGDYGEPSFEDAMKAAMDTAQDDGLPAEEALSEPGEVQDGAEPEAVAVAPESVSPVVEAPETPEATPDKSLAKLMEKEQSLLAREQKYEEAQGDLKTLRSRLDAYESNQSHMQRDPIGYLKSLAPDIDMKRLAEMAWFEHQGEAAPKHYQDQKAASRHTNELVDRVAKVEQGLTAREQAVQEQESQRAEQQYIGSLQAYAASAKPETHPLLTAMRGKNEKLINQGLENIARGHARATEGREVLSPEQCADLLEKELDSYQVVRTPAPQVTLAQKPAVGTSLRNSSTQINPDREAEDPLSNEYLHRQAMIAAGLI